MALVIAVRRCKAGKKIALLQIAENEKNLRSRVRDRQIAVAQHFQQICLFDFKQASFHSPWHYGS
jgi:hypothetical protein